jgi:hypothetical protein
MQMRLLVWFLLMPMAAFGADLKDLSEARTLLDGAMASVAKDDVRGAFSKLKPYWLGIPDAEIEVMIGKLADQRRLIAPRFGKSLGTQFVSQKAVADTAAYFLYIEKYEKHLVRWHFYFYRPKDRWQFNSVNFDDRIQGLFD